MKPKPEGTEPDLGRQLRLELRVAVPVVLDVVDVLRVEVPVLRQRVVGHHLEPGERLEAVLRGEPRNRVDVGVPGLGSNSMD